MPRPDDAAAARPPVAGPRLGTAWAALTYAVATLLLGWPALAGRFLVNPHSDQYIAGHAFREFAASHFRQHGGFPLWNPYLFGGMPYVAAMHGDIFYPTFLLRLALGTDAGMTWGMILHVFLAGLFAHLFLRRIGIGFWGALVGGLAYLMGGNVAGLVSPGHDGKIFLSALLPLTLLLTHRAVRDGRRWAWGALVLTIVLAVLTPHPQLLQYLLLVMGAYTLFLAFTADESGARLPRNVALARIGLVGLASALGLLGGAVQFWPVLEYTPWSPRAGGKGWDHAISYSMPPEELINTYLPQFSGILDNYLGRNAIHFHSEYLGAAVLVLAALGIGAGIARTQRRFWIGLLVVATLWALGGYTPFYYLVYYLVPGTKFFRAPSTMLYVVQFATAVLAAYGVDRLVAGRVRARAAVVALGVAGVIALLGTSGLLTNLASAFVPRPDLAPLVDRNAADLTLGAWRSFLAVAAVAGVLLAMVRGRLRPAVAGAALAAIVAVDLWSIERRYWLFSPPAEQLFAADPVIRYLQQQSDSGRVVPIAVEEMGQGSTGFRDPYLGGGDGRADGLMSHGVRSAVGYHGNELGNWQRFTGWATDWPRQLGNPNFWKLANIRFLYTNSAQPPIEGATLVAGPARNVTGTMTYLYRLPGDNPPAWVAPIAVEAPDEAVLGTVLDPRFDVRTAAIFDTASTVVTQPVPQQLPAPLDLTARVTSRAPGRIALALSAPAPANAALVVSENYYPGWTATVDGRPAAVGRANYTLLGVGLPAGAREIVLTFTSPRYETGKAVTLAVLALGSLALAAGFALDRRRRV